MSIADTIREMHALGCPIEAIIVAVEKMEAIADDLAESVTRSVTDAVTGSVTHNAQPPTANALRQRAFRARKKEASVTRNAESNVTVVTEDPLPPSPLLSPQTPQTTPHPPTPGKGTSRTRKADPFPMPDGVDPQHWADFLVNRKRKGRSNTETAHKRLRDDLARFADDEWPPPRLIEHAAAMGWAGIYDPRKSRNGHGNEQQPPGNDDVHSPWLRAAAAYSGGTGGASDELGGLFETAGAQR